MPRGVWGHLVCHNEHPADVLRAIESIYPICNPDPILVVHDGSTKQLVDFLEARKGIYNMKVFKNPFTTVREQRQFLLDQTPIDNWVVALDADEKYSLAITKDLRHCLLDQLSEKHYEAARGGNIPLVINIPVYNLIQDITHYDGDGVYHSQKIFYYEKGLHWDYDPYFCHITYKKGPLKFEDGVDTTVYSIIGPKEWVLLHYARLNPERKTWRKKHLHDSRYGNYDEDAWEDSIKGIPTKVVPLEKDKW